MTLKNVFSWLLRLIVAVIFAQTLFFKFSGAEESVKLFTTLGIEPWGRYLSGIIELITVILVLVPSTVFIGALLGLGVISGAIISHLTVLGIESGEDGGLLFILALVVWLCCTLLLFRYKKQGIGLISKNK